jgi:hypothetical protein
MRSTFFISLLMFCLAGPAWASDITRMEYFYDSDPGVGNGTELSITSGSTVTVAANISLPALDAGLHHVYFRAMDADGDWSISRVHPFYIPSAQSLMPLPKIDTLEYFIDDLVTTGLGNQVAVTPETTVTETFNVDFNVLSQGVHYLYLRARDSNGVWGNARIHPFYVLAAASLPADITSIEYFINTDPGYGAGTAIPITSGSHPEGNIVIDLAELPVGEYTLAIRARDADGIWSPVHTLPFEITDTVSVIDSDNDGIHDQWEEFYFGSLAVASADSDYDNDGYLDVQEYLNWAAGENDPYGQLYDPKVANAPGGTGYSRSEENNSFWLIMLPAILNNAGAL